MILDWLKSRFRLVNELTQARLETRLLLAMNAQQERTIIGLTAYKRQVRDKRGRFAKRL